MNAGTEPPLAEGSHDPGKLEEPGQPGVRKGTERWFSLQRVRSHLAALTSASRVTGIDVARALAIIGMIGAHVGYAPDIFWSDPSTWGGVIHGRSAILFAVLAGVSIALVSGGTRGVAGAGLDIRKVRLSLVGRGIFIFAVGVVLEALGTSVSVILGIYGVLFVLAAVFVDWRRRWLLITAGVLALGGPSLLVVLRAVSGGGDGDALTIFAYSMYPPLVWLVFVMAGVVVARSDVRRMRTALATTAAGVLLAVVGYAVGIGITPADDAYDDVASADEDYGSYVREGLTGEVFLEEGFGVYEHSGGTMEIIGSGGFALAVTGLCLLTFRARLLRRLVVPIAALGSMPLTAYAAHIVAIRLLTDPWDYLEDNQTWLIFVISLVLGCTLWALLWGRGPLERLTGWAARALSAAPTRHGAPADPPVRQ